MELIYVNGCAEDLILKDEEDIETNKRAKEELEYLGINLKGYEDDYLYLLLKVIDVKADRIESNNCEACGDTIYINIMDVTKDRFKGQDWSKFYYEVE